LPEGFVTGFERLDVLWAWGFLRRGVSPTESMSGIVDVSIVDKQERRCGVFHEHRGDFSDGGGELQYVEVVVECTRERDVAEFRLCVDHGSGEFVSFREFEECWDFWSSSLGFVSIPRDAVFSGGDTCEHGGMRGESDAWDDRGCVEGVGSFFHEGVQVWHMAFAEQ